jgi:phosphoenolpyruvate-protein phosphotransferase
MADHSELDIHARLVRIVAEAQTATEASSLAARAVAAALRSDWCGIFMRSASGRLQLHAGLPDLRPDAQRLAEIVGDEAIRLVVPATAIAGGRRALAAPMVSRGSPIGVLVIERAQGAHAYSLEERTILSAVASQMVGLIVGVRVVEMLAAPAGAKEMAEPDVRSERSTGERCFVGAAASPGIAIGVAAFRNVFPRSGFRRDGESSEAERRSLRDALQKTRNDLVRFQSAAAGEIGEEEALIFGAHLLLLSDPLLLERIEVGFAAGASAAAAVDDALENIIERLRSAADPTLRDRVEDVEDVRGRLLGHLLGSERRDSLSSRIVIGPRATPSIVIELKAQGAEGIASEIGTPTSHGVLLARALGVPAVTGVSDLVSDVCAGDAVIIDGDDGRVIVRPTPETLAAYAERRDSAERLEGELLEYRGPGAESADGVRVRLQANIALGVDLGTALANGAEGIGLYRTEFPFIARDGFPTVEEQARIYGKAYDTFPDGPITFRILDVAADKFVAARNLGVARHAWSGYRSIKLLFDYPHVLRDQVQALAIAAAGRPLRILVPMVTSLEDLRRVKDLMLDAVRHIPESSRRSLSFGAMVETPAAVEIAGELAAEVDFLSIGTNDLIQYSIVADREDPRQSSPRDAFHPAILRMVRRVISAAHEVGREVGLCGEMATVPELCVALVALGIDSLSVTPRALPRLRKHLAGVRVEPLRRNMDAVLALSTTDEIERALRRHVDARAADAPGGTHRDQACAPEPSDGRLPATLAARPTSVAHH